MQTIIFKSPPGGQFHFGRIALDDKTSLGETTPIYHSDTFASALVDMAYRVLSEEKAAQVLEWFKGSVRFSSFSFCLEHNGQYLYFLPKPVSIDAGSYTDPKPVRKVQFLSKGVWENGVKPDDWSKPGCRIIQKKFVLLEEEWKNWAIPDEFQIFQLHSVPKVFIHKVVREDNLYFHTNVALSGSSDPRVHWYCLVKHSLSEDEWRLIQSLIEIIASEGIGGERSVGCGALEGMEWLSQPLEINVNEPASSTCTLSLTCPHPEKDTGRIKSYRLITRGGRKTAAHGTLKRLKMLAEGAIVDPDIEGTCHNIKDDKSAQDYFRFGYPLHIPVPQNFVP